MFYIDWCILRALPHLSAVHKWEDTKFLKNYSDKVLSTACGHFCELRAEILISVYTKPMHIFLSISNHNLYTVFTKN